MGIHPDYLHGSPPLTGEVRLPQTQAELLALPHGFSDPEGWQAVVETAPYLSNVRGREAFVAYMQFTPAVALARHLVYTMSGDEETSGEIDAVVMLTGCWEELTQPGEPALDAMMSLQQQPLMERVDKYRRWIAKKPGAFGHASLLVDTLENSDGVLDPYLSRMSELDLLMLKKAWLSLQQKETKVYADDEVGEAVSAIVRFDDAPLDTVRYFTPDQYLTLIHTSLYRLHALGDPDTLQRLVVKAGGDEAAAILTHCQGWGGTGIANPNFVSEGHRTQLEARLLGKLVHRTLQKVVVSREITQTSDYALLLQQFESVFGLGRPTYADVAPIAELLKSVSGEKEWMNGFDRRKTTQAILAMGRALTQAVFGSPDEFLSEVMVEGGFALQKRYIDGLIVPVETASAEPVQQLVQRHREKRRYRPKLRDFLVAIRASGIPTEVECVELKAALERPQRMKQDRIAPDDVVSLAAAYAVFSSMEQEDDSALITPTFTVAEVSPKGVQTHSFPKEAFAILLHSLGYAVGH